MKKLLSILLIATCAFATAKAQNPTLDQKDTTVCPNTKVKIKAEAKAGYVFIGWSNDASSVDNRTIIPVTDSENANGYEITAPLTNGVTYYAVWGNKVFYKANPDYNEITLNTSVENPDIAETGKNYEINSGYYTVNSNTCHSIKGYIVYAATNDQGGYDPNSTPLHTITLASLLQGEVPSFQLNQNVVIVPDVQPGTVTITIKSEDQSMGTVSFVR